MLPTDRTAVLAWGSLVNQTTSPVYNAKLEIEGNFKLASGLKLPIRMSRLSSANNENRRYTLVIDRSASDEKIYAATSKFGTLNQAKENLKKREGTILSNISYLKLGKASGNDEKSYSVSGVTWSGKKGAQLSKAKAKEIIKWATNNNYSGVIWTALAPNVSSEKGSSGSRGREILASLRVDPVLLNNTKKYIQLLPYTTALQKRILNNQLQD